MVGRFPVVTSTVSVVLLSACRACTVSSQEDDILSNVGIAANLDRFLELPTESELLQMRHKDLKNLLISRGLPSTGAKQMLIDRLRTTPPNIENNVRRELMKKWFMKPIHNTYLKMGSVNESFVLQALPVFLRNRAGEGVFQIVEPIVERGLLRFRNPTPDGHAEQSFIGTSIDGAAVIHRGEGKVDVACVLEIKTMCSPATIREAEERRVTAAATGLTNQSVFVTTFGSDLFKVLIWTTSYRAQALHHAAVTNCCHLAHIVADMGNIISVTFVEFSEETLVTYRSMLTRWCQQHVAPFATGNATLTPDQYGHAVDLHTFTQWRELSKAILALQSSTNVLPPAHDLVPVPVDIWNIAGKGGQDVNSRVLKNMKVDFRSLSPLASIGCSRSRAILLRSLHTKSSRAL